MVDSVQLENKLHSKAEFSEIFHSIENKDNNPFYKYNQQNNSDNINDSNGKGINYTRSDNNHVDDDFFKSNSHDFSNPASTQDINYDLVKKRSNKTIHITMSNKKNDLSQTNKIFERNNNEIYFSKRK